MLDNTDGNSPNDIAIVGMALRVPGARTVGQFWSNLVEGRESIRDVSPDELTAAGETLDRIHHPNYVRRTAEMPDMEMFDADFFGLSPKEAAVMDPQHRQFLECAWEAMEDAGRTPDGEEGPVGVFAGCGMGSYFYFNVCSNRALVDQVGIFLLRHTGNDKDFLSTRASFVFDLRGPSVNVQTACSTSLVAVHYACQSLLNGECDMALAGGVTIELPHRRGYLFQEGEILSPDGHCRPFDHRAAGTVFGSGVGVVALRRLSDALADGDIIHAVIKSTAINNDGHAKAGYLAPSVSGQATAVIEAQTIGGVSADTIHYVECHGTGTALGDPIEVEALTQAFRRSTSATGYCRIGSVKSNIGHLDTAAGVVSLIKASLAVKHALIPPTVGFQKPNPAIRFDGSPFMVADRLADWPHITGRRRAAVNSLGVGGTNAHAIVEQAPFQVLASSSNEAPVVMVVSAASQAAADAAVAQLGNHLSSDSASMLEDVAHTLWVGRKRFLHNRVIAAKNREDALAALAQPRRIATQVKPESITSAAFLFPGGGAQYHRMGAELYANDADFRAVVEEGLASLPDQAAAEIRSAWFEPAVAGSTDAFLRPSIQLPAILLVEVAVARLWMRHGVQPAALLGHSMGENAAACIAGVIELRDAVRLVRLRGELFDTVPAGGMLSVPLSGDEVRAILPASLDIASVNAPGLSVVSGLNRDLEDFAALLAGREIETFRIPIDIAAHSRSLDAILPAWEAFLRSISLRAPKIPIVSNLTGDWLTAEEATDPMYWVRHLRSTVLFEKGMSKIADAKRLFIEVGPGKTLCSLAKAQGSILAEQVINSLPHPEEGSDDRLHFLTALGRAAVCGLPVEPSVLWGGGKALRITLPTYPFQHNRYFIEPSRMDAVEPELVKLTDMSQWGYRPIWKQSIADYELDAEIAPLTWLFFLDDGGVATAQAERLRHHGHRVVTVSIGDAFARRTQDDYVLCPELGLPGYVSLLQALAADGLLPSRIVHMWLVTASSEARAGSNVFHRNQECGFYSLLHTAQALGELEKPATHITVVSNGMHKVGAEPVPYPEKATVLGPALVIPRELAGSSVKLIDIETAPPTDTRRLPLFRRPAKAEDGTCELVWADIMGAPGSEVVAYRNGKRWSRSYGRLALGPEDAGRAMLKQGGTYLFTGGLGGIARVLARSLAAEFKANLVMLGRKQLPPREDWLAYRRQNRPDAVRRGIEAILELEAAGAQVLYHSADVTDPVAVRAAVQRATDSFGGIDGVFHAAGVVDDGLIQTKTSDSIEDVLAPKLLGTQVLDEALRDVPLDFFVLFSSTSTVTAPAGQVDYVAANAYLDAYADSRAGDPSRKTISLHWGIWNEVGLGARSAGVEAAGSGISETRPDSDLYVRWSEDEAGIPCLEAEIGPDTHWFLDEHRLRSGTAVLPGTAYFELIAQAARAHSLSHPLSIRNLVMLRPLIVPDGETRTIQTSLEQRPEGLRISICAGVPGEGFAKHAEALVAAVPTDCGRLDIGSARSRLPDETSSPDGSALASAQERHINFGLRWKVLRSTRFGPGEALAELELPAAFHSDMDDTALVHPALLDIATGFALPLFEGYRDSNVLWAPASYGEAWIGGKLPSRLISHVSLVPNDDLGPDFCCFDIDIADTDGNLVFQARRFVMTRLATDDDLGNASTMRLQPSRASGAPAGQTAGSTKLAVQVRQGIAPSEGFTAFLRALGSGVTQPIVSSLDIDTLRAQAARQVQAAEAGPAFERPDIGAEMVEPRNQVEATLAGYWRELLGVSKVGVHDSFFDLGGHSLIAVRLFRMIKKEYGADLPISTLFSAPTIAQCAELITPRDEDRVDAGSESAARPEVEARVHLTLIHPGRDPRATPLFICAGMFGNILNLRHLGLHIGADRPVYGLQARGLYGDMAPHESFEAMAKDYVVEMRTVCPNGPYYIAGYSGGGITALEIARELRQAGEDVPHVIMLDTPQPAQPPLNLRDKLSMKSQDLRRHKLSYLGQWLRNRESWRREMKRKEQALHNQAGPELFNNDRIEKAFRQALGRYTVTPYEGAVTVFRPRPAVHYRLSGGRRLQANRNIILDDNGWTPHIRDLTIVEVPGDHDSMVLEPHVRFLAQQIRRMIDHCERRRSAAVSFPAERPAAGDRYMKASV